jgi:glycosyltransferase involved in cell wall biosynthesis
VTASVGAVALCFGTYPPERNGGADFVARLASALARMGIEPHVITSAGDDVGSTQEAGVTVHRVVRDWAPSSRGLADVRLVNGIITRARVGALHVFFPDSVYQGAYQLPALMGLARVPLVATWWNLGLGRRSPTPVRAQSLALLLRARVLTSHDPGYLAALRRAAVGRTVEWLPVGNNLVSTRPAPDRATARRLLNLDDDATWLGFFGQLDPTRGVEDLFAALAILRRTHDARLLMIGSAGRPERYAAYAQSAGYFNRVRALPAEHGLEEAVLWTGYLPDDQVLNAFAALDLCVLPYRRNSIGRSALATALATGSATVLAGAPADVTPLRAGEHVALVPRADPSVLAATLARLIESPAERERLARGAAAASGHFSWEHIAERAGRIYARLAD